MTEKLYYKDSHLYEFSAKVAEIIEENGRKAIVLDKTAFFPEGGGQPADTGHIGDMFVFDVRENDGKIFHYTNDDINFIIGQEVECRLNAEQRFARMQAHSGEHIVSGVAHNLFGVENVGFHMIDLVMTVDFDKPLSKEQITLIEKEANKVVVNNERISTEILSAEKLRTLHYRSKLELTENVRIVTIEGVDRCACCAPHVSMTGEIGIIKILSCISHRGGVRLTLICGIKAFDDYCEKHRDIMCISDRLKVPNNQTPDGVFELEKKLTDLKYKISHLKQRQYAYIYKSLTKSSDNIILFIEDFAPDELRELAELCKKKTEKIFAVFSGDDISGYAYVLASENKKLKALAKDFNAVLHARGGGREEMLQGRAAASAEEIKNFMQNLRY